VGGLYIHPEMLASLEPTFIGWRGLDYSQPQLTLLNDARRYEVATSAYPLYAGLRAAIATHQTWGSTIVGGASPAENRAEKIVSLATYLWQSLQQVAGIKCLNQIAPRSGLVSFQVATGNHAKLVKDLEDRHFYLRTIVAPDCIRACTHYFTTIAEIDELVGSLSQLIK
jgi:L-cysteine/cystine lyase